MLTSQTHNTFSVETNETYYQALLAKDSRYDGVFFVGVRTTGVFCRPTCPARKPRLENCEFFASAQAALLASYRPCKRCRPLSHPSQVSDLVRRLVEAVEADPAKRWTGQDFRALEVDVSTARRQFKKRFGMTFVAYARARRMGLAMKQIRNGESVIGAQLGAGYDSGSGFRDAFAKIMGSPPTKAELTVLKASWLDTPLGPILAVTSDNKLYLLEFTDRRGLEREVERLRQKLSAAVVPGRAEITAKIEQELNAYFAGTLQHFTTPLACQGTPFQRSVWQVLQIIPLGETRGYAELACALGKSGAVGAVAQAKGANPFALVVPCHRVVNSDGQQAATAARRVSGGCSNTKGDTHESARTSGALRPPSR